MNAPRPPNPWLGALLNSRGTQTLAKLRQAAAVYLHPSDELKARQLVFLSTRGLYWIWFVLLSALVVVIAVKESGTAVPHPLFFRPGLWQMHLNVWATGLVLIALPGFFLHRAATSNRRAGDRTRREIELFSAAWVVYATVLAVWWSLGIYVLQDAAKDGPFLINRAFIWLTALGHVITVVLLASNWVVVLSVLLFGCLLPGLYALQTLPSPTSVNSSLYWLCGQMGAFFLVTLLFHSDQRRLLNKQISLERERFRVDAVMFQKNKLLENFSHDLLGPLTALGFQLLSIKRDTSETAVLEQIEDAFLQKQIMVSIVETARDLAHAEFKAFPFTKREISLQEVMKTLAATHKRIAENQGTRLSVCMSPVVIHTDRDLIMRIIQNLLSNALKYSRNRKGSHVLIGCRKRGDVVRISVHDNGIGIPQEHLTTIFDDGVQLNNPERDRKKGIGLGLSIVRAFAALLGHKVGVRSEVGKGSVFWIDVPYVSRVPLELQDQVEDTDASTMQTVRLSGLKVLLVEDQAEQLMPFAKTLESSGCVLKTAQTLDDVQAIVDSPDASVPDLLITDFWLPGEKTGADVIRLVRSRFGQVPTVIWSAANKDNAMAEVGDEADVSFVAKGRMKELAQILHRQSAPRAIST